MKVDSTDSQITVNDNKIMLLLDETKMETFKFDKVFSGKLDDYEIYISSLLPLLEIVLYQNKDATMISFGPKKSGNIKLNLGKTSGLGVHESFSKTNNILKAALSYFFSKSTDITDSLY